MEKRRATRFPLSFETRLQSDYVQVIGSSVNISSCGVLMVADGAHSLQPGNRVEAEIGWPVRADDKPVRLKLWGTVAWTRDRLVAVDAKRYSFEIEHPRIGAASETSRRRNPFFRKPGKP